MPEQLPHEGQISLEQAASLVHASPKRFGLDDIAFTRSVLVQQQDGGWINHCTVLYCGGLTTAEQSKQRIDRYASGARLIGASIPLTSLVGASDLIEAMTAWRAALPEGLQERLGKTPYGPAVEPRPWDFQESVNLYRRPSDNPWGKPPCWTLDLYDRSKGGSSVAVPSGPFRHDEPPLFASDIGALVTRWCGDPSWRESNTVQNAYRIVLPDRRGYIERLDRRGRDITVTIGGMRPDGLKCAISEWDQKGDENATTKDADGQVSFLLRPTSRYFEVFIFERSDAWCDRSRRIEVEALQSGASRTAARRTERPGKTKKVAGPKRADVGTGSPAKSKRRLFGDQWEIVSQLKEGGQAYTYIVRDIKNLEAGLYVLKRLKNPDRLPRFRREIEVALALSHPAILRVYASNLDEEPFYFVTEHCPGGSLADAQPFWRNDPVQALRLFEQICSGVAYAHAQGVIHRDIKPANILLRQASGPPVIADFGICFLKAEDKNRLTETAEAVGPRLFMAPELEDGRVAAITESADSYSLGKLLYWMLSGGKMFSREKHRQTDWDLKVRDEDTLTGWRNIFLDHVNQILDVSIVAEPRDRRDASNLAALARQASRLIEERRYPLATGLRHPCAYCGRGYYALKVEGTPTQVQNFGFSAVGGAQWRIYACTYCGHVQAFRTDLGGHKEPWGDRS